MIQSRLSAKQLHVSAYYRNDSHHNLYTPNIIPVVVDAISYDGTTKPPVTTNGNLEDQKSQDIDNKANLWNPLSLKHHVQIVGSRVTM